MYLITGLGNPGRSYSKNRHNVGFMLVDLMAAEAGMKFERRGSHSHTCRVERAGEEVILAKPQTYMNLSGRAVQELLEHYPVDLKELLIVYDELALPLGTLRIRRSGSSSGQKGMQSIIGALGTQDVPRLRIGIEQGEPPDDYSAFVLDNFRKDERKVLEETLDCAIKAIDTILSDGIEQAMSIFN